MRSGTPRKKRALNKCSARGKVDDFDLIGLDSDIPDVVSVQKKTVIDVDDDEVAGGVCSDGEDSATSTACSSRPMHSKNIILDAPESVQKKSRMPSPESDYSLDLESEPDVKSHHKVEISEKNAAHCKKPDLGSIENRHKAETGYRCQNDIIVDRESIKETEEYKRAMEEEWASRQRQLQIQAEEAQRLRMRKRADDVLQDLYGKPCQNDIIVDRQSMKETDEYKRAMEEEWASRQRQLQIQAEEAQRLRKLHRRKNAESMRTTDMERRQKQRVEEVRETQKKDEANLKTKEQLRIEIKKELKLVEGSCRDMASLLQRLGLLVSSGSIPSQHEVQAAYKRALLKFHPDRVSRTDIRQLVEAEEKFKLISRLKEKFSLG